MKCLRRAVLITGVSIIFVLSACASPGGAATPTTLPAETAVPGGDLNDLVNTQWQLVSFGPVGQETAVSQGAAITIQFDGDGQAAGFGGCNSYSGQYTVQGGAISFGEIVSTLVACVEDDITQQEQQYLQALQTAESYTATANSLTISYNNASGVLNFASIP